MRLFRTRDDDPADPNERSPQLGVKYKDLAVMGQLMDAGADLAETRHVVYYSYAPSREIGEAMQKVAESNGWDVEVREPLPDFPGQWAVVCETHAITSPDFVRSADNFFEALAEGHGAEYDGWEASV